MNSGLPKVKQHNLFRARSDKIARVLITLGGWTILLMLGLMIWHLVSVAAPLGKTPVLSPERSMSLSSVEPFDYMGDLIAGEVALRVGDDCHLDVFHFNSQTQQLEKIQRLPFRCSTQLKLINYQGQPVLFQLSSTGHLKIEQIRFDGQRVERKFVASVLLREATKFESDWQVALSENHFMVANKTGKLWQVFSAKRGVVDDVQLHQVKNGDRMLLMPGSNHALIAYSDKLVIHSFNDKQDQVAEFSVPLQFMASSHNDHGFVLAFGDGEVEKWLMSNQAGRFVFKPSIQLSIDGKASAYWQNEREHLGILLDDRGKLNVFNLVSGANVSEILLEETPLTATMVENRFYFQYKNKIDVQQLHNPSAAINFASLWHALWYSGYDAPSYVWQSASSEGIEPKYSLVPLVVGSVKAAFYALLIAVPLSLGAAIYSSYFLSRAYRKVIKPTIELLEAVPSVVIGFLLSTWLISWSAQSIYVLFIGLLLCPLAVCIWSAIQQGIVRRKRIYSLKNTDLWVMLSIIVGGFLLAYLSWLGLFAGVSDSPFLDFIERNISTGKNTLVVAIALGIAITPTIYTLAEDAIHGVPMHYQQASYALGATQLQTLQRVVLKVALPGIVSAVMLGFGRAFGETMIVLMVTGNTPVADWGLLSGLRTLGANLAIELPHSEVGSGHYQVLFLTALLLFGFTFVINTVAELVRNRFYLRYDNV